MAKARRFKHLFGGAMRQAGIVAAAGLYALDHHVQRLADDHANARRLAEGLVEAGMPGVEQVETNFVLLDAGALGLGADEAVTHARRAASFSPSAPAGTSCVPVTHLDVSADDVEEAVERIPRALTGAAPGTPGRRRADALLRRKTALPPAS